MNKRCIGLLVLLAVGMMLPFQVYAATPQETVENGVNEVLKTLADPAFEAKTREVKINKVGDIVGTIFDYEELSKRTLGRDWKKMSAGQQKEFVKLFTDLPSKQFFRALRLFWSVSMANSADQMAAPVLTIPVSR